MVVVLFVVAGLVDSFFGVDLGFNTLRRGGVGGGFFGSAGDGGGSCGGDGGGGGGC